MNRIRYTFVGAAAGLALVGSLALAQSERPSQQKPSQQKPAAHADHQLPAGVTEADMQACIEAATPGAQHEHLAKGIGVWDGKTKMWMTPDAEPMQSTCVTTCTAILDGRFVKCETTGEMPGMGPFNGFGLHGFDNVAQQYQAVWVDNFGTGMATGTGQLASDNKTMTWSLTYNCPMTKSQTTMREVERITGKDTKTMMIFAKDPVSGGEYKMMEIAYTRRPGTGAVATVTE